MIFLLNTFIEPGMLIGEQSSVQVEYTIMIIYFDDMHMSSRSVLGKGVQHAYLYTG